MRLTSLRSSGLLFALALLAGAALFASPAAAHPGHSSEQSTPWYRYLPPGTPAPALPAPH